MLVALTISEKTGLYIIIASVLILLIALYVADEQSKLVLLIFFTVDIE